MIQAIETHWKGYRFRSRLEARWAVFFERLGWEWKYEAQGYRIGWNDDDMQNWLPDFEVKTQTHQTFYAEVKGDPQAFQRRDFFGRLDFDGGPPGFHSSHDIRENRNVWRDLRPIALLGNIPHETDGLLFLPFVTHHEGVHLTRLHVWPCGISDRRGDELCNFACDADPEEMGVDQTGVADFQPVIWRGCRRWWPQINDAFRDARSARFEHGEAPEMGRLRYPIAGGHSADVLAFPGRQDSPAV